MSHVSSTAPRTPSAVWTLAPWALAWMLWVGGIIAAPKFEEIFRDFGVALPLLTVGLLQIARQMHFQAAGSAALAGGALWLLTVLLAVGSFALGAIPGAAWHRALRLAGWLFLALMLAGLVLALGLPLLSMQQSLRGGAV